jgi:hypothetical protein
MPQQIVDNVKITWNFISGAFVRLDSDINAEYLVTFQDGLTGEVYYETTIDGNSWCKCSVKYFVDWLITLRRNDSIFWQHKYNAKDENVLIEFDSHALGDIIGWFPYIEEFRKKHECNMYAGIISTQLFNNEYYPEITFVRPRLIKMSFYSELYARYRVGLYLNESKSSFDIDHHKDTFVGVPHQQICSDILGLEFREIKPIINEQPVPLLNQVCIATFASSQPKFWNNATGWQEVVSWLISRGYVVKLLGAEPNGYHGNYIPSGVIKIDSSNDIHVAIRELKQSKLFIGLGSGLSWLAWALNIPVVLISGFSNPSTEMQSNCIRISAPSNTCSGCYNRYIFKPSDWNWCPDQQGTTKQFECSKKITSNMVIQQLEKIL